MYPWTWIEVAGLLFWAVVGAGAVNPTTEAGEASIQDPYVECTPYSYPPVLAAMGSFPAIWKNVTSILTNDTVAREKFLAMNSTIPNIPLKGTLDGDRDALSSAREAYPFSDPDCWWTFAECSWLLVSGLSPDVTVPEPRTLGYGFSGGPNCSHNAFYDYLAQQGQKATMFFLGSNVMKWPLEALRAVTDGHEICVHTWSAPWMTAATNEGAFAELYYTIKAIKLVTGFTPTCWRPPHGDVDDRIRYIAVQLGLETIMWGDDSKDSAVGYDTITAETVQRAYDRLIESANFTLLQTAGTIFLMHEINNFTMQTAMDYYPKILAAFDYVVPIAVAQNKTQPYVEANVTMPSFAEYAANHTKPKPSAVSPSPSSQTGSARRTGPGALVFLGLTLALHLAINWCD
ncbi:carbohydrate esterase family 4 protein [Mycena latifolia]|nr:carbohydrate esterase family 4 protein [Mycena latifolia]